MRNDFTDYFGESINHIYHKSGMHVNDFIDMYAVNDNDVVSKKYLYKTRAYPSLYPHEDMTASMFVSSDKGLIEAYYWRSKDSWYAKL